MDMRPGICDFVDSLVDLEESLEDLTPWSTAELERTRLILTRDSLIAQAASMAVKGWVQSMQAFGDAKVAVAEAATMAEGDEDGDCSAAQAPMVKIAHDLAGKTALPLDTIDVAIVRRPLDELSCISQGSIRVLKSSLDSAPEIYFPADLLTLQQAQTLVRTTTSDLIPDPVSAIFQEAGVDVEKYRQASASLQ
eukprot:721244-Pyramimonas_sp.AAC.1